MCYKNTFSDYCWLICESSAKGKLKNAQSGTLHLDSFKQDNKNTSKYLNNILLDIYSFMKSTE